MKAQSWRNAMILGGVAAVVAWMLFTMGDEPVSQAPGISAMAGNAPREGSSASHMPFLSSHEPLVPNTSAPGRLDPSFHVELQELRQHIREDSTDGASILKLAQMLHDSHQFTKAIVQYERYLKLAPDSREAWLDIGKAYGSLEEWQGALAATDSALARYPEDPAALYNKGAILANMGRPQDARDYWLRVERQEQDPHLKAMAKSALDRLGQ